MIVYNAKSWGGYGVLCHLTGSVFHKVLPQALMATAICIAASLTADPKAIREAVASWTRRRASASGGRCNDRVRSSAAPRRATQHSE